MITYFNGTVFNTNAEAIVNTVNCMGVMSAGIALEYSLRYPEMFKDYEKKCKNKLINVGLVDYYKTNDVTIVNFPTKWHFKYPSQLNWIEEGLINFVKTYKRNNITSVAFPKLGTNNGKLLWSQVQDLMEKYLNNLDIPVYICLDNMVDAQGIEKIMIDMFNNEDFIKLKNCIKISNSQIEKIKTFLPINRFWKIKEIDGVGTKLYKSLFVYYFELAKGNNRYEQVSFFNL